MPPPIAHSGQEDSFPPRFYWTKRVTLWSCIVLALVALAWLKWQHDANAARTAYIEAVHARGEPLLPADFLPQAIPDSQNPVFYYDRAIVAITARSPFSADLGTTPRIYPRGSQQWWAMTAAFAADAQAIALARQARQYNKADWHLQMTTPIAALPINRFGYRALAYLLIDTAVYEHVQGDDAQAIERLRDVFHLVDVMDQHPILAAFQESSAIDELALAHVELIGPRLRITDDLHPAPTTQPIVTIDRQVVRDLIALLVEDAGPNHDRKALIAERANELDLIDFRLTSDTLLRPMFKLDSLHGARQVDQLLASTTQSLPPPARVGSAAYLDAMDDTPVLNRIIQTGLRDRTESNFAAVILAARLYQIDHDGNWPAKLDALVPGYLPAVPVDLYSTSSKPLGYITLNNGKRPIVYSVGPDGIDQTAQGAASVPAEPQIGRRYIYGSFSLPDMWRDVSTLDPP